MNHWFEVHKARAWCCWKMQRCSWTLLQLHIVVFPSARRIRICDRIQECTKVRITFRHHICDALEMEVKNLKQKKIPKNTEIQYWWSTDFNMKGRYIPEQKDYIPQGMVHRACNYSFRIHFVHHCNKHKSQTLQQHFWSLYRMGVEEKQAFAPAVDEEESLGGKTANRAGKDHSFWALGQQSKASVPPQREAAVTGLCALGRRRWDSSSFQAGVDPHISAPLLLGLPAPVAVALTISWTEVVTVAAAVPARVAIAVPIQAPVATIQTSKAIVVPRAIEAPVTIQTIMAIAVPKVVEATKAPVVVGAAVVIAPVAVEAPVTVGEVAVIVEESHLSALRANLEHSSTKKSQSEKRFTVTAQSPKPSWVVPWGQGQMQFLCYTSSPIPLLSTSPIYHHQIFFPINQIF